MIVVWLHLSILSIWLYVSPFIRHTYIFWKFNSVAIFQSVDWHFKVEQEHFPNIFIFINITAKQPKMESSDSSFRAEIEDDIIIVSVQSKIYLRSHIR